MADPTEVLSQNLLAIASLLLSEGDLSATLRRVSELACTTVPGCDHAGVTLVEGDKAVTAAATDDTTLAVDAMQYESGQGPCLEAIRQTRSYRVDDITDERFPVFVRRAGELGINSTLSCPLIVQDKAIGALNLYSESTAAYDQRAEHVARIVALQAGVTLANAQAHERTLNLVEQLNQALLSRAVIDQAKGILMARQGCTAEEAFTILRRASQGRNRKLRELAQEVVDGARASAADGKASPGARRLPLNS